MKRHPLGRTAVEISELGFGAAPIGNLYTAITDEHAFAAVTAAWDLGIRYFDTAPHYGLGLSEHRLGIALADRPRGDYVVSTKVGRLLVDNCDPRGSDLADGFDVPDTHVRVRDYSADGVLRSLEASLPRLRTDRVDLVFVHDPDDHLDQAIDEALPALARMRDEGVVGAIGAGMNAWQPLARIVRDSDVDAVMIAGRWTLIDRTAEPLLEQCQGRGVSVIAAAPFNSGLLSRPWPPDDAYFDYGPVPTDLLEQARSFARTCQENGIDLPHAALQFPLRHPAVAGVVAGMRSPGHVQANVDWMNRSIPQPFWDAVG